MKTKIGLISLLIISAVLLSGCRKQLKISDEVSFFYTGYFSDGILFETGEKTVVLGSGEIPNFMEKALLNIKGKKELEVQVSPSDAYGPLYLSGKLQKIPRFLFEKSFPGFDIGDKKILNNEEGIIKGIELVDGYEYVLFEMNPKQTRDDLKYDIQILDR